MVVCRRVSIPCSVGAEWGFLLLFCRLRQSETTEVIYRRRDKGQQTENAPFCRRAKLSEGKTYGSARENHRLSDAKPNVNDNGNENVNVNEKGNVNGKGNGTALQGRQPHTFHPLFRRKSGNITGGECEWILPPGALERKGVKGSCLCSVSAS